MQVGKERGNEARRELAPRHLRKEHPGQGITTQHSIIWLNSLVKYLPGLANDDIAIRSPVAPSIWHLHLLG
jgi:hypothetical protein